MLCSAVCGNCGELVEKDVRMFPHFLPYKAQCSCGALVALRYRANLEASMAEAAARKAGEKKT